MDKYADFVFAEMEKAEKELKPCPFCGCQKVAILRDNEELYRSNFLRFRAVCEKCSAQIYRGKIPQLVESWNRRATRMAKLPMGKYIPFDPSSSSSSCDCTYSSPYNEQCEFYHKEYHMGGYISTCLNQDVFGWCNCDGCLKWRDDHE